MGLLESFEVPIVKEEKGVFFNSSIFFSINKTAVVMFLEPRFPRMAVVCKPTRASRPMPRMAMAIKNSISENPLEFLIV